MSLSASLQPLIDFLQLHPNYAGAITFLVVFCEAMAVVGVIIPGSVTMTAIGALVGAGIIPAGPTFAWGVVGAILGDVLSYWIGIHFQDRLHRVWPFNKHPQLLEKSEVFFKKHGGKSVFIGRFIGPMRAMVPMVAGMFKMPVGTFLLAAIPSVSIWAVVYMLPGVIIGALSLELPPKVAMQFILAVLTVIAVIWATAWIAHHFAKRVYRRLDKYIMRSWLFMQRHKTLHWVTELLADPREPENHQQLSLLLLALLAVCAFLIVLTNVATAGVLTLLNTPLYHLLVSARTAFLDHVMVMVTLLGESQVLLSAGTLFLAWLVYKRYWYIALHWFAVMLLSAGAVFEMKSFLFFPRPDASINPQSDSSFPSGHTVLSLAFIGFWSVIVARELLSNRRWLLYTSSCTIIALISLSRLYLGVHWLTDILGGILLGVAVVLVLTISYRRRHTVHFSLRHFVVVSVTSLCIVLIGYSLFKYPHKLKVYSLHFPQHTITLSTWESTIGKTIPLYRNNRLGRPIQAFNVEWLGALDKIEQALTRHGWEKQPTQLDLPDIVLHLAKDPIMSHLPLLPQLYHDRPIALLMTKKTNINGTVLVLRLWQSDITVKEVDLPLWLGVVDYHYVDPKLIHIPSRHDAKHSKFVGAAETLSSGRMGEFKWHKIVYSHDKQPQNMQYLNWDGTIFLASPR